MMSLKSTKILWISLLTIGLVSSVIPTEAVEKGAIGLHRNRMLRADVIVTQNGTKPTPAAPGPALALKTNQGDDKADSFKGISGVSNATDISLADSTTNETAADENSVNELAQEEVESTSYSNALESMEMEDSLSVQLPLFTFTITTDSSTDEIDTSQLSSFLSAYLLEQLRDELPESFLEGVFLDVEYEYKPQKTNVDGVGFASDNKDSVHIFNATGTVLVRESSEIPTENQIFAETRDSLTKGGAEKEILTSLQESEVASLQAVKTFSISEVNPHTTLYLMKDSHSTPLALDIFLCVAAVMAILAAAFVARDKAMSMYENKQSQKETFGDEESECGSRQDIVYTKKNLREALPPTPPITPPTTPYSGNPYSSGRKSSSQLISLSDFNIMDELSHLGETSTIDPNPEMKSYKPTNRRSASWHGPRGQYASVNKSSSQLLKLSDFNIVDEFMCGFDKPDPSRIVRFKDDATNNFTIPGGVLRNLNVLDDACGPIVMADGVGIDNTFVRNAKTIKEDTYDNAFDCGVEDLQLCADHSMDYEDYYTYRSPGFDDTISHTLSDGTEETYS